MRISVLNFGSDVKKACEFFGNPKYIRNLPFLHDFPNNSCEIVTAFLASAIASKYNIQSVKVIHARSPDKSEQHFWLEVGEIIVDATAHQFKNHKTPLVCLRPNPLEKQFPHLAQTTSDIAMSNLEFLSPQLKILILNELTVKITT